LSLETLGPDVSECPEPLGLASVTEPPEPAAGCASG